jgi:catechol 2,3-dioxygenase-like lactoylglutathione lyase family enzyme
MTRRLDHVVLWVEDPLASVEFYERIVGLAGVRVDEFRRGEAPFPSVRVAEESIIDLMARSFAPVVDSVAGGRASAGHPVNHVCLAMPEGEFEALRARLAVSRVSISAIMESSFGARGLAPRAFYFRDPDDNVIEARYYR